MSDTVFCYHCRARHPIEEVRQISTKSGKRWRCTRSIVATKKGVNERDDFGRQTTAFNKAMADFKPLPMCLMERHPLVYGLSTVSVM
ncbi:hypothetical protein [Propionivibrio sp.]|uniref:hypothetical protein n=1 Tax=Propionivibrio sp. TaxID=2212460 RepID=UPI003BF207A0